MEERFKGNQIFLSCLIILGLAVNLNAQSQERLEIRYSDGQAKFYPRGSSEVFVPRGFNYIQLVKAPDGAYGESELFQPGLHDEISVDDDFQRIAALGYNVVRVFVDLCREERCLADASGLRVDYMSNVVGLLKRAKQYGIYVMLTANWLPDLGGYSGPAHLSCEESGDFFGGNCLVLSQKGVELYQKFFTDFVQRLKALGAPLNTIWAYELRNEFFVEHDQLPFVKKQGLITTANGSTYDMASASDRTKMGEDGVVYWANSVRAAIKKVDEDALVTAGFFTPNSPNILREGDQRIVPFEAALTRSDLDFLGIHAYPGFHDFELEAENYGIMNYSAKPIILGEYGTFLPDADDEFTAAQIADHWQSAACTYGIDGFTYWTWERHRVGVMNRDDPWGGNDASAFIGKVLSPYNKVNSCDQVLPNLNVAKGRPTRASMETGDFVSANAVDGNATETPWISGGEPPQWIEVDLQTAYDLKTIQLVVETGSDDPHFYTHEVQVKASASSQYKTLHVFAADRVNFETISYSKTDGTLMKNVRYIRVLIPQAPGWAALHELRAFLPEQRSQFDVPPPPTLTFPRPGLEGFEGSEVRWKNDVAGLMSLVEIARDPDFQEVIDRQEGVSGDSYTIDHLEGEGNLFWRVQQENEFGNSFWSVTGMIDRSFVATTEEGSEWVEIYPNPAFDRIFVELDQGSSRFSNLSIYSTSGQKISTLDLVGFKHQVDMSFLHPGVYVFKLHSKDQSIVKRVIKFQ